MNHYEILGVPKTASYEDIKKAYRELAKTKHPDKGGNEEEFRKIQDAYNVLCNPQKREEYDNPPQFPPDINSIFASFFGGMDNTNNKSNDIHIQKKINLEDIWKGNKISIEYERKILCNGCDHSKNVCCKRCGGKGSTSKFLNTPMGRLMTMGECDDCKGLGALYDTSCESCNGRRVKIKKTKLVITLPRCFTIERMVCEEKGHCNPNGTKGSCIIFFIVDTAPFILEDNTLIYRKEVSLLDALFGCEFKVKLPDDTFVDVKNNSINQDTKNVIQVNRNDINCSLLVMYKILFPQIPRDKYDQVKSLLS